MRPVMGRSHDAGGCQQALGLLDVVRSAAARRGLGGGRHKRLERVYCQRRLNLPRWTKKRWPLHLSQPLVVRPQAHAVRAGDCRSDTRYGGRGFAP
jgi:hypothetical protein